MDLQGIQTAEITNAQLSNAVTLQASSLTLPMDPSSTSESITVTVSNDGTLIMDPMEQIIHTQPETVKLEGLKLEYVVPQAVGQNIDVIDEAVHGQLLQIETAGDVGIPVSSNFTNKPREVAFLCILPTDAAGSAATELDPDLAALEAENSHERRRQRASEAATARAKRGDDPGALIHKCQFCEARFKMIGSKTRHERMHRIKRPFKCAYCPWHFHQKHACKAHERTHTGEKPFKCKYCDRRFAQSGRRRMHEKRHEGLKPFTCYFCKAGFDSYDTRARHEKTHDSEKPYKCQYCDQRFTSINGCRSHESKHLKLAGDEDAPVRQVREKLPGDKPFKCEHCDKRYAQLRSCKLHELSHTEERPFKCQYCDKRFLRRNVLLNHERVHTGEKPYKCAFCSETFAQKNARKRHEVGRHQAKITRVSQPSNVQGQPKVERIVNEEAAGAETNPIDEIAQPFQCRHCVARFKSVGTRKRHELVHTQPKTYPCSYCPMSFHQNYYRKAHERTHTGERPFKCKFCDMTFAQQGGRSRHERTHGSDKIHKCFFCDERFRSYDSKEQHEKTHNAVKPYKCQYCTDRFGTLNGVRSHESRHRSGSHRLKRAKPDEKEILNWKPFHCMFCTKKFKSRKAADRHEDMAHSNELEQSGKVPSKTDGSKNEGIRTVGAMQNTPVVMCDSLEDDQAVKSETKVKTYEEPQGDVTQLRMGDQLLVVHENNGEISIQTDRPLSQDDLFRIEQALETMKRNIDIKPDQELLLEVQERDTDDAQVADNAVDNAGDMQRVPQQLFDNENVVVPTTQAVVDSAESNVSAINNDSVSLVRFQQLCSLLNDPSREEAVNDTGEQFCQPDQELPQATGVLKVCDQQVHSIQPATNDLSNQVTDNTAS